HALHPDRVILGARGDHRSVGREIDPEHHRGVPREGPHQTPVGDLPDLDVVPLGGCEQLPVRRERQRVGGGGVAGEGPDNASVRYAPEHDLVLAGAEDIFTSGGNVLSVRGVGDGVDLTVVGGEGSNELSVRGLPQLAGLHHFQGTDNSPRSFLSRTEGRRELNFGLSPGGFYLDDVGPPLYELWFAFRVGTGPFPDRGRDEEKARALSRQSCPRDR